MSTASIRNAVLRRKNLLSASIVIAGGFVVPDAAAATWTVNSCSESISGSLPNKTGTLRFAAQNAGSGDTIDLTQLENLASCSTITLKTGAVNFAQNSIILEGSANSPITLSGKYCTAPFTCTTEPDRLINHTGTGTIDIYGMSVVSGYPKSTSAPVFGGCVYSAGNVILDHSIISQCTAKSGSSAADGGALFATGTVSLIASTVSKGYAKSTTGAAFGGGIFAGGTADVRYSSIQDNKAIVTGVSDIGFGGGLEVKGSLYMLGSTVSGNSAGGDFGGVYVVQGAEATKAVTVKNSTISGNSAGLLIGGLFTSAHSVLLDNSTFAFNTAGSDRTGVSPNFSYYAPGVSLVAKVANVTATLQSTLIANNTAGSSEYDLSVATQAAFTVSFNGSNNLVRATFAAVPADTIKLSCPLLGPLRNNGGPVETHALLSHSPGIDQGNNVGALGFDQRGSPFARISGTSADIGAYEVQQGDILFNTSFESCPILF